MALDNRFWHYDADFDAVEVVRRHAASGNIPVPGHYVNYFGVAIATKFFPSLLADGGVETETIPANWHADIAEFAAALRAVDLASGSGSFVMAELGCGWGCWMNITGAAARRAGINVHLIGIEGDEPRIGYARESLTTNGFRHGQYTLHHGIAAAKSGTALFPTQAGDDWGQGPIFDASAMEQEEARQSGSYEILPMISLETISAGRIIDLLHVDIQGGEIELAESAISILNQNVAYMVIGTHSRSIEGRLYDLMSRNGWRLEMDRSAIHAMDATWPAVKVDGVQGWRNLALRPQ